MIPVRAESKGPSHLNTRQPGSHVTSTGTPDSRQTIDNSCDVLQMDMNCPRADHAGTSSFGSRRQTEYRSGKTVNVRRALGVIAAYPFFHWWWSVRFQSLQ